MKNIYWLLFSTFAKIGAFTFGGGYAMIPVISTEIVEKRGWIDDEEMVDILAIAESTPGPLAINSATFIGYKTGGLLGSVVATFGVVLPSFLIIYIISMFMTQFRELVWVSYAFKGIQAGVVFLVLSAAHKLISQCEKNIRNYCVMAVVFLLAVFTNINVIFLLIGAAVFHILYMVSTKKKEKEEV